MKTEKKLSGNKKYEPFYTDIFELCRKKRITLVAARNKLIRKAMLADNTEEQKAVSRGPMVFCTACMKRTEFKQVKDNWLCFKCGEDKTEVIEYHLERLSQ